MCTFLNLGNLTYPFFFLRIIPLNAHIPVGGRFTSARRGYSPYWSCGHSLLICWSTPRSVTANEDCDPTVVISAQLRIYFHWLGCWFPVEEIKEKAHTEILSIPHLSRGAILAAPTIQSAITSVNVNCDNTTTRPISVHFCIRGLFRRGHALSPDCRLSAERVARSIPSESWVVLICNRVGWP